MRFTEIASRLTGISCPVFGVSWNPPEAERSVARRIITFLEDRRVLFVDSEMEVPAHCVESVHQIREMLTRELAALAQDSELAQSLRAMRAACRKFLQVTGTDRRIIEFGGHHGHYASWTFNGALGELRGVFGIHIAKVATAYGHDVEADLSRILPDGDTAA